MSMVTPMPPSCTNKLRVCIIKTSLKFYSFFSRFLGGVSNQQTRVPLKYPPKIRVLSSNTRQVYFEKRDNDTYVTIEAFPSCNSLDSVIINQFIKGTNKSRGNKQYKSSRMLRQRIDQVS